MNGPVREIGFVVEIKEKAVLVVLAHEQFGQVFPLRNVDDLALKKINPRTGILAHFQKQKTRLLLLIEKLHQRDERELVQTPEKLQPTVQGARFLRSRNRMGLFDINGHLPAEPQVMADDLNLVAKVDDAAIDALTIDVAAVRAGQVDKHELGARILQHGMLPAHLVVVQDNIVRIEPSDIQDRVRGNFVNDLLVNDEVGG